MGRPTKRCAVCGKPFERNPSYGRVQWAKALYCSNICRGTTLAKGRPECACGCGETVSKAGSRWRRGHKPQLDRIVVFQRHVARGKARWFVPARDGTRIYWARIVMRNSLGRELLPTEVVHHANGDSEDDRPENLRVYASHAEHMRDEYAEGRLPAMR